jgi:hypothetical protein
MENIWPVETRDQALAAGKTKYWTGKNCKRDHRSRRYTASGACIECVAGYASKYQKNRRKLLAGKVNGAPVPCPTPVHPDDIQAMHMLAEQLNTARGIETHPLGLNYTPTHDPNSPEGIAEYYKHNPA